jgi:isoleucyl-tRNA synthetase
MANAPDYKKTLNLPKTDFPMKANLPQREPEILARWREENTYQAVLEQNRDGPVFRFHDGPPYANNHIHQGHMLNRILKDLVIKSRSMDGKYVDFVPGWDCHGLPIELQVDKQLGKKKRDMSLVEIRDACRAYALEWVDIQREEFRRLGLFGKWDDPYLTMDYGYEAATVREFAKFAASGALYRGKKPVHWCIHDRTALAEAEVEYDEHVSPSIWVGMDVASGLDELGPGARLVIWTTTPWTLPANLAISVHPDFEYVAYALGDRPVVVAKDLLVPFLALVAPDEVRDGALVDPSKVRKTYVGRDLEGVRYHHPFLRRESPVILGDHVTLEAGSGLVHTAPGHGQEDYVVGQRYGLDVLNPVDDAGVFTEEAGPELVGKKIFDGNDVIIEMLRGSGHLLHAAKVEHSYPHCWRCSRPVVFRATDQWFISMEHDELRAKALAAVDEVRWIPKWGRERIHGMLENRPDWCVSRQRAWGTPIPVLYCDACDEALVRPEVMERAASLIEAEGGNAWFERPASDFAGDACCGCGGKSFRKEQDILDVWFDSGVSFAAVLEPRQGLPADLYLEGSDQHRGWFHSSLLCAVGTRDEAPYRAVLTHGFVVDGEGRKLSKRLGNYVDPAKLIAQHGAELVRLWVASEDFRSDIRTSPAIFQQLGEASFRIRNTPRYCLPNLHDFDPARHTVAVDELPELERWVHHRLGEFVGRVRRSYESFEFHIAYKAALDFCANEVSAVLADIRKDILYCDSADSPRRRAVQTVLFAIARDLCRVRAPVLSFTTEEAWAYLPGEHTPSVFLAGFPEAGTMDPALGARFEALFEVRGAVSKQLEIARREKSIGKSVEARVVLGARGEVLEVLRSFEAELAPFLIVSQVEVVEDGAAGDKAESLDLHVQVLPAAGGKCVRCWIYYEDLGTDPAHPELCPRCTQAVIASS